MKLSWGAVLSSICSLVAAAAAAKPGYVFLLDPIAKHAPKDLSSVSPETARLILAQRLGLSRFHSIKDASQKTIQEINTYGGRSQLSLAVSSERRAHSDAHVLVWIDNAEDVEALINPRAWTSKFLIENPPSGRANADLVRDLILQAESLPKKDDSVGATYSTGIKAEALLSPIARTETYNDWLTVLHVNQNDIRSLDRFSMALSALADGHVDSTEPVFSMTVVFIPPSPSKSKRSAHSYGSYDLPVSIGVRREKTEAPISLSSSNPSTSPSAANVSEAEGTVWIQQSNNSPVLGILPPFYSTEEACFKQTHNCSSHGLCTKVRNGTQGKDGIPDRWSCKCQATRAHVGEDKGMESKHKTTYWGGPACQKKDVSQPFWLFVATGVLLAFLISAGIGLLYSVGSEELPSVIGAGVSGPVARK